MSAVAAAIDSLAFDFTAAAAGARQFVDNRPSVTAYIAAIRAVQLGAHPIVHDGRVVDNFDPLAKLPDVAAALTAAKQHADDASGQLDFLHDWAQGKITTAVGMVITPVTAALNIFNSAGGRLSNQQRYDVLNQMTVAEMMSGILRSTAISVQKGLIAFLNALPADHEVLANGPNALAKVKSDIDGRFQPLMIFSGIREFVAQYDAQLDTLINALSTALTGHEAMRGGLSAFTNGIQAAVDKYTAANAALRKADSATLPAVLKRLDLKAAIASLNDMASFILHSRF